MLRYKTSSKVIIRNQRPQSGVDVDPRLSAGQNDMMLTRLAFWFTGPTITSSKDLSTIRPIGISLENGSSFGAAPRMVDRTQDADVTVSSPSDTHFARINFEVLNRGDRAIVDLLHSGRSGRDVRLVGHVRGGSPPMRIAPIGEREAAVYVMVMVVATLALFLIAAYLVHWSDEPVAYAEGLGTLPLVAVFTYFLSATRARAHVPRELRQSFGADASLKEFL